MDKFEKNYCFIADHRLGINIPVFQKAWEGYSEKEQEEIIQLWERERAKIPDRIKKIEQEISEKQNVMLHLSFEAYCELHKKIVDMASIINDLNIWYRTEGTITKKEFIKKNT